MLSVVMASPASADKPAEYPIFDQFEDTNPCTGLEHMITFEGTERVHEHKNNVVIKIRIAVTTSDGFEGNLVGNVVLKDFGEFGPRSVKDGLNAMLTNSETGQKFSVKGQFRIRNGEFVSDTFRFRCIRN
jgi:hypothetical protein